MLQADVAVVGGGPAGAAAAITLARAGRDVVLFDKARFPRDKCCGDGLTTGALRRYERLGLRPDAVASWQPVTETCMRSPSGHTVSLALPTTGGLFGAVARRADLDAAFLDVARAAGVKVYDGHGVTDAAQRHDLVELDVDGVGPVLARYVVAADGMWSPLRKKLGVADEPGYLGEWHALRQYFADVDQRAARQLWVWFDADLLPGYAWSFPLPGGRANVGFGIHRSAGRPTHEMKGQWADLLERPHIRSVLGRSAQPEAPPKAWPIPARIGATELVAGRVLFAGDAARATDTLTGEGIGQALETGELAAQSVIAGGPHRPALRSRTLPAPGGGRHGRRRSLRRRPVPRPAAPQGRPSRGSGGRGQRLDQPQLRALDVGGLPPSGAGHAAPLAPRHAPRPRRLPVD